MLIKKVYFNYFNLVYKKTINLFKIIEVYGKIVNSDVVEMNN